MLKVGDIAAIRRLHFREGWTIRRIAQELGHSRRTVRKALRGGVPFSYTLKKEKPKPVSGSIEEIIRDLLVEEKKQTPHKKQRLTAARIETLLRDHHDYQGGSSTVRRIVARIREEISDPLEKAFVPLAYEPGVDAQVDFLEADVDFPTGRTRTFFLLVRACYSGRPFLYAAPNQTQQALFEGLMQAFEYFGGIFKTLWFDNLTPAVRHVLKSRARELQKPFEAFKAYYCFDAEFCGVAKGNEKGGVENGVGYARRNALVPIPKAKDRFELQEHLLSWMVRQDSRIIRGRPASIESLWQEEKGQLIPLPAHRFDIGWPVIHKVSTTSLVQDNSCFYSVPVKYVGKEVILKRYTEYVEIHSRTEMIARHPRLYGRGEISFVLEHYLPLLLRKARAFDRAAPVKAQSVFWPPTYPLMLSVLRAREGMAQGTRSFIQILMLHQHHDSKDVHEAVKLSLSHQQPCMEIVRLHVDALERRSRPCQSLSLKAESLLAKVEVDSPDLAVYGQLCQRRD